MERIVYNNEMLELDNWLLRADVNLIDETNVEDNSTVASTEVGRVQLRALHCGDWMLRVLCRAVSLDQLLFELWL